MATHTFSCIDGHTCGNPVRLVSGGGPRLEGATMLEKRAHFLREFDWIRTGLMFEPRGHDMMSGSILYPPTRPDCDVAVLFIETSGCLPMCGHGTIGTVTMGIENGLITPREPGRLAIDTPAGKVEISLPPGGPLRRGGAADQRPRLPPRRGADRRGRGAGRDRRRRRLRRQLLRHRRAAEELPRHGRPHRGRARRLVAEAARGAEREVRVRPPRAPGDPRPQPHRVDRQAHEARGACAQRRLLWRQGHRPLALRHRHLGADGAARRQGQARRWATSSCTS